MRQKGFTLVELLAVIVLIAIITTIGTVGVIAVKNQINKEMWKSTVSMIEMGARTYGEYNKSVLKESTCTLDDGSLVNDCKEIQLQKLIERNYISTKEKDRENNKVLIDNTKDESTDDSENYITGYYVNNAWVRIYIEDGLVYAQYLGM